MTMLISFKDMTIQLPVSAIDPSDNNGASHISANFQTGGNYYLSRVNCSLLLDSCLHSPLDCSALSQWVGQQGAGQSVLM